MSHNMGNADRAVRAFLIAPLLIVLGVVAGASSVLGIVLFVLAAVMLATSAIGFCPLYAPFGLNTCRTKTGVS
jgi:hypothetical protein